MSNGIEGPFDQGKEDIVNSNVDFYLAEGKERLSEPTLRDLCLGEALHRSGVVPRGLNPEDMPLLLNALAQKGGPDIAARITQMRAQVKSIVESEGEELAREATQAVENVLGDDNHKQDFESFFADFDEGDRLGDSQERADAFDRAVAKKFGNDPVKVAAVLRRLLLKLRGSEYL